MRAIVPCIGHASVKCRPVRAGHRLAIKPLTAKQNDSKRHGAANLLRTPRSRDRAKAGRDRKLRNRRRKVEDRVLRFARRLAREIRNTEQNSRVNSER